MLATRARLDRHRCDAVAGAVRAREPVARVPRRTARDREVTPLWQPGADRIAGTRLTRSRGSPSRRLGRRLDDFNEIHRLSVGDTPAFWDAFWEFAGVHGRARTARRRRPRSHARRAVLSGRAAELRRERAPAPRRRAGDHRDQRKPATSARSRSRQLARRREARGAGAARGGRRARRSRVRPSSPTCPRRSSPRSAPPRSAPSGRRARRISACRACSIASARSSRPCSSPSTAISTAARRTTACGKVAAIAAAAAEPFAAS